MVTARKVALLLAAAFFAMAQAHIVPYFDQGEIGSGVFMAAQQPVRWAAPTRVHVFKAPAAPRSMGTSGHVGTQWLDPGFTSRTPKFAALELVEDGSVSEAVCRDWWAHSSGAVAGDLLVSLSSECMNVLA